MAVNNGEQTQGYTLINALYKQATGKDPIGNVALKDFVSVANVLRQLPANQILDAMGQVMKRTIFSIRPYVNKFDFMRVSDTAWGGIVRKFSMVGGDPAQADTTIFKPGAPTTVLDDGDSVDRWKIKKPNLLQTNFYGSVRFQKHITRFEDQLMDALSSEEQFVQFWQMVMTEFNNEIQNDLEALARATMLNYIAGKIDGDASNVIHCITEYKDKTGDTTITEANVFEDTHFVPFVKWLYARINTLSKFMTNRTTKYHMNINGKEVVRHTPIANQKCLLLTEIDEGIKTQVLSSVYHNDKMKTIEFRDIDFWQDIDTPYGIHVTPNYLDTATGLLKEGDEVVQTGVLGVIYDDKAFGVNAQYNRTMATPVNERGLYSNLFYHGKYNCWNDFTENGIVLLLD